MDDIHLAWFDHWLKGVSNEAMNTPRRASSRPAATAGARRTTGHSPPVNAHSTCAGTARTAALAAEPAAAQDPDRSYRYDPLDPVADPARRQAATRSKTSRSTMTEIEARPDVLTYTSEPLAETVVVSGWPHLEFWASSDRDDTEWHVKLTDVDEDGRSIKVCQGCLRASYRDSLEHPTPLTPGEPAPLPRRALAGPPRLPARTPHPSHGHLERLPLVRPQPQPVRPAQGSVRPPRRRRTRSTTAGRFRPGSSCRWRRKCWRHSRYVAT